MSQDFRTSTEGPPRASLMERALWFIIFAGGLLVVALSALSALVLAVTFDQLLRAPQMEPAPAPAPVSGEVAAAAVLRERALVAIREADYDRAVALTTEAAQLAPGQGDLQELLEIARDLQQRRSVAAIAAPEPDQPARPTSRPAVAPAPVQARPVGIVIVTSSPKGVPFEIPGVTRGHTPFRALDVPIGEHDVIFYRDEQPVHTAHLALQSGTVELVDVNLAVAPEVTAPSPAPAPPAPVPPAPEGPARIYVFVPGQLKARALQDALSAGLPGVVAFGSFQELQAAQQAEPAHAVLAPRSVLDALGLPVSLQGLDAQGASEERYLLLGPRTFTAAELEGRVIGTVDVAGRTSSGAFVARLLGTSQPPQVKRVAEQGDLLPLLQFGTADAILLPADEAPRLKESTQMSLVEMQVAAGAGLPAFSVLDEGRREQLLSAVRALGPEVNAKVGVNSWSR